MSAAAPNTNTPELSAQDPSSIVRFVNTLLTQAIKDRASDIHIECNTETVSVRFRIDGVLSEVVKPPLSLYKPIAERLKMMARLDIAECSRPQSGNIRVRMAGQETDLTVFAVPTHRGERIVVRLLRVGIIPNLKTLGLSTADYTTLSEHIQPPHKGLILFSAPVGCGKTTSLYAILASLISPDRAVATVEDIIELDLPNVTQLTLDIKRGVFFPQAITAALQQDPDVLMVGEIRDRESENSVVHAGLASGPRILSTLNVNAAAGVFNRLTDMGIDPSQVANSVRLVVAQRLVRRLCEICKLPWAPDDETLAAVGLTRADCKDADIHSPAGCPDCLNKGYRGRFGLFEILTVTDDIRRQTLAGADTTLIKRQAITDGMQTLRRAGIANVFAGHTSFAEVLRMTPDDAGNV